MRGLTAAVGIAAIVGMSVVGVPASTAASVPLSIKVVGNHFVNGMGHTIRLLGVDRTSSEYGCVDGFGYDDGHFTDADAAAIASWGANAVRIPLNEDCWLGINGQPNSSEGVDPALTQAGYQHEIVSYVADLHAHGIYAILDLHWSAPGAQVAMGQQPMPDQEHSPAFWTSVAATFKSDPAVVFDLFNEPFDPTDPRSGDDTNSNDKVTWSCWETGKKPDPIGGGAPPIPCFTEAYDENGAPTGTRYQIAGLQTLLNAVRATGARQPFMTGGLDYANDLGEGDGGADWMDNAPDDPLNQEAASFHNYMGKGCDNATCWKNTIAPVARHVPVVTGEFAEDDFDEPKCNEPSSTFDRTYMNWADSAGVSYLAWAWVVETQDEKDSDACSAFVLIDNYSTYTPAKPNGVAVHDHLRALAAPAVTLKSFSAKVRTGNRSIGAKVRTAQASTGTVHAGTVHTYLVGGHKRKVSLGTAHFTAKAGKTKTVVLKLSATAHKLLVHKRSLNATFTITMSSPGHRRTVRHHTSTLKARH